MKAKLRGITGPAAGMEASLEAGVVVLVGRHANSTLPVPGDSFLSGRHCELILTEYGVVLRDVGSSNGTFINEERIQEKLLRASESFRAGGSVFQVEVSEASAPGIAEVLSSQPEPVYAVLDAARDSTIYPMLMMSGGMFVSLYAGDTALKLEAVSPYLVHLPPGSDLLNTIVEKGWGQSWGIFLTSSQPMQTVWHELRRSLMVTLESTEKWVYFRFYDPRVLRVFLPVADAQQRAELFGTISSILLEGEDPSMMVRFTAISGAERVTVAVPEKKVTVFKPQTIAAGDGTQLYRTSNS